MLIINAAKQQPTLELQKETVLKLLEEVRDGARKTAQKRNPVLFAEDSIKHSPNWNSQEKKDVMDFLRTKIPGLRR